MVVISTCISVWKHLSSVVKQGSLLCCFMCLASGLIYIAEGVSAGKRALARVLIIIVCEGFGTVK